MGCASCGGKSRRPLRTRDDRVVQQGNGGQAGSTGGRVRSVIDRMRYTGKGNG